MMTDVAKYLMLTCSTANYACAHNRDDLDPGPRPTATWRLSCATIGRAFFPVNKGARSLPTSVHGGGVDTVDPSLLNNME